MIKTFYIKLNQSGIEPFCFCFYGNDCYYHVDIFDERKNRIGNGCLRVRNCGTEPDTEFLYEYDCNQEEDRAQLAQILGLETIENEWYDGEGTLIIDRYDADCKMPAELIDRICTQLEESHMSEMTEYYYEALGDLADENGYITVNVFLQHYQLMTGYSLVGDCFDHACKIKSVENLRELWMLFDKCGSYDDEG